VLLTTAPLGDIGHVIQLAIAPVFLLTAIGTVLAVLTGRLGRAVDRRRSLMAAVARPEGGAADLVQLEIAYEVRRIRLIYVAISMAVMSALLVCGLISLAFIDAFMAWDLGKLIAVLFVLAMLALIGSLSVFLREIFVAVNSPRAPVP
jgi:Protein of unknown function (DUF2721)